MKPTFRECRVHGCTTNAVAYDLLCLKHWRMVPAKLANQVRITTAWVRGQHGDAEASAHGNAAAEAIAAVEKLVTPPGVTR